MTPAELTRFKTKYAIDPRGCWLWTGADNGKGYGQTWVNGRRQYAHRASFVHYHGPVPKGHDVCHRCDVPSCVNPTHLFAGTRSDNMRDMSKKGRASMLLARLTAADLRYIRAQHAEGTSTVAIADRLRVSRQTVGRVLRGRTYRHTQTKGSAA